MHTCVCVYLCTCTCVCDCVSFAAGPTFKERNGDFKREDKERARYGENSLRSRSALSNGDEDDDLLMTKKIKLLFTDISDLIILKRRLVLYSL